MLPRGSAASNQCNQLGFFSCELLCLLLALAALLLCRYPSPLVAALPATHQVVSFHALAELLRTILAILSW